MNKAYNCHASAIVDDGACIGEGTRIWHFTHVSSGARIGAGCVLGQNVFVGGDAMIGNGVKIQNNVSIYNAVTLEDDVFIGPSAVFTNVKTPRSFIERKQEFSPTRVKKGATLGANCTIICGTTIGEYALIGAGAVVTHDVPAHALMTGVPAQQTGWVSHAGEVLGDDLICPRAKKAYQLVQNQLVVK